MSDALASLRDRLEALESEPVATHPDVLEQLHTALVGELDALASPRSPQHGSPRPPG